MRKLLVASQKGGVGKTTTSMNLAAAAARGGTRVLLVDADPLSNVSTALNLAEHPDRRPLRPAGIPLPGAVVANVVPGLDVLSPYDDGPCTDADLDRLLQALASPAARQCYGCVIVDSAPFLGANPAQLVGSCDEFLLVMRAEPMAHRTLPAFLELIQRSSRNGSATPMRGILLTLPEGEEPGGRWERELRGRFGARVLPEVIPQDETIVQALRVGKIGSHLHPDSPAALQYRQLAKKLGLAGEARPAAAGDQVIEVLRAAASAARPAAVESKPAPTPAAAERSEKRAAERPTPAPRPEPAKPGAPPANRARRTARPGEVQRPVRPERPAPAPALAPSSRIKPSPAEATAAPPAVPLTASPNALGQLWPLWILLGAVLGGGLRFVPPPSTLLPVLVGLGVALLVVVGLTILARQAPNDKRSAQTARSRPRTRELKKAPARSEPRKDPIARLASLANGAGKNPRRGPHPN